MISGPVDVDPARLLSERESPRDDKCVSCRCVITVVALWEERGGWHTYEGPARSYAWCTDVMDCWMTCIWHCRWWTYLQLVSTVGRLSGCRALSISFIGRGPKIDLKDYRGFKNGEPVWKWHHLLCFWLLLQLPFILSFALIRPQPGSASMWQQRLRAQWPDSLFNGWL